VQHDYRPTNPVTIQKTFPVSPVFPEKNQAALTIMGVLDEYSRDAMRFDGIRHTGEPCVPILFRNMTSGEPEHNNHI
jgi:hypothetical protein